MSIEVRKLAVELALKNTPAGDVDLLICAAQRIEQYLDGEIRPEQPLTPDPQSSEGESAETMVEPNISTEGNSVEEVNARRADLDMPPLNADDEQLLNASVEAARQWKSNGTTHPEQQD
ncbi:MAG: hypothetical protein MK130_09565 [Puniceicoccaceae bacterium]|nr:hypothetical protein [Puniceicoccaceae bacterium]